MIHTPVNVAEPQWNGGFSLLIDAHGDRHTRVGFATFGASPACAS